MKIIITAKDLELNPELIGVVKIGEEVELGPLCNAHGGAHRDFPGL